MAVAELGFVTGPSQSRVWPVQQYLAEYRFLLVEIVFIFIFGVHHGHLTFLFCSSHVLHVCAHPSK